MKPDRYYLSVREFARRNRRNQTPAERFLWDKLRNRQLSGAKFLRQHVIRIPLDHSARRFFVADFYCHAHKLIVEVDGPIHRSQVQKDFIREALLEQYGYTVLRITNDQILSEWELVKRRIEEMIKVD